MEQSAAHRFSGASRGEYAAMFIIKWMMRYEERSPVRTEESILTNLESVFERCVGQLEGMRLKNSANPPDGFIIYDEDSNELRRWFKLYPANEAAIIAGAQQRLRRRRPSEGSRAFTQQTRPKDQASSSGLHR